MRPLRRLALTLAAALSLGGCQRPADSNAAGVLVATPPEVMKLLSALPPAYAHADLDNGRLHFSLCRSCHTAVAGGPDMTGPNLFGVFGRRVASKPGYGYSEALRRRTWVWDADHLDAWLKDPRADVPGTKMSFVGLADDHDRRDTIAYLKVVSSGGPM